MTNFEQFVAVLTDHYCQLFDNNEAYSVAKARYTPEQLAEKMALSLKNGAGSKDGDGIKRTCKALGVAYTYKAINAYLA
jgi:hypothetical protein